MAPPLPPPRGPPHGSWASGRSFYAFCPVGLVGKDPGHVADLRAGREARVRGGRWHPRTCPGAAVLTPAAHEPMGAYDLSAVLCNVSPTPTAAFSLMPPKAPLGPPGRTHALGLCLSLAALSSAQGPRPCPTVCYRPCRPSADPWGAPRALPQDWISPSGALSRRLWETGRCGGPGAWAVSPLLAEGSEGPGCGLASRSFRRKEAFGDGKHVTLGPRSACVCMWV